jgi:hypothetical protein
MVRRRLDHAMGATMPFSKFNLDPEHAETTMEAFRRVCEVLHINANTEDPLTAFVVLKIVELAKAGELDPERLCNDVLAALESPSGPTHEPPVRGH